MNESTDLIYSLQDEVLFISSQVSVISNIVASMLIAYCIVKIRWNKLKLLQAIVGMNRKVETKEISSSSSHILLIHYCMLASLRAVLCIQCIQVPVNSAWKAYSNDLHCVFVSGIYFLLLTVNAFNLLAISIAEAYQYTEKSSALFSQRNKTSWATCCCAGFAILTLWFGSVIVNLGVTFVPIDKSSMEKLNEQWRQNLKERNSTEGYIMTCALDYGVASGYGTQLLRGSLALVAIAVTTVYLYKFNAELFKHRNHMSPTPPHRNHPSPATTWHINTNEVEQLRRLAEIQGNTRTHLFGILAILWCFSIGWLPYFLQLAFDPIIPNTATWSVVKRSVALMAWTLDVACTPLFVFCSVAYSVLSSSERKISKYNVVLELINVCESELNTDFEPLNSYFDSVRQSF